jgi:hypothetical protein
MKRISTICVSLLAVGICGAAYGSGGDLGPALDALQTAQAAPLPKDGGSGAAAAQTPSKYVEPDAAATVGEEPPAPPPKPWKLPQPCFFQKAGIDMGGWVQQGITGNAWNPADGFNGPITTNDRSGEYMLNQAWLYFVRPTKTDGCGFDIGGRIDVVYGEDWRFGQCLGLETRIDDPNSFYGLVLPQFYMEVAYNDLTVKMGHFATLTSLEVVPSPMNFFYSHSYLMAGYYDPLLVTGLQAEYKLNDNWTAIGGFNRGWQLFENPNETLNFLGGVKWASDDKKSSLSLMVIAGPTNTFAGFHDVDNVIMVYTRQLTERFFSGTQVTVGRENGGSVIAPGQDDSWYGFEQIFTYKLNPKWSAGVRYEWVCDNEGSRVAGIGNVLGTDKGWLGAPGFAGAFSDLSVGLNYRPHPNFVFRPEVRWDWYDGERNPAGQMPFNAFGNSSQFTAAVDMIVTF